MALSGYHQHDDGEPHAHADHDDKCQRTAAMMIMLDPRVMYGERRGLFPQTGVIINPAQTAGRTRLTSLYFAYRYELDQAKAVMVSCTRYCTTKIIQATPSTGWWQRKNSSY
ncbi:hypothetical protein IPL68_01505 [Candidatus Saccharibacteria bacterium]|nr:MAG: hypothetical protein IPL68_01505 [Candidatus Saccharibacteria bacterium]